MKYSTRNNTVSNENKLINNSKEYLILMQLIAEYSDSKTQNITRSDARVAYARRKKVTRLLPQCLSILWTSLN